MSEGSINGKELNRLRRERNVTQGQLAKILRVSRGMIALLESNDPDARPGDSLLSRIRHWVAKGGTIKERSPSAERGPRAPYK